MIQVSLSMVQVQSINDFKEITNANKWLYTYKRKLKKQQKSLEN